MSSVYQNMERKGSSGGGILIQRCSDSSCGIRARALSNLAQLVGFWSSDDKYRDVLKEVMGFGEVEVEGGVNDILRRRMLGGLHLSWLPS